jgi:PAS domain S-box-containing protein
LEAKPDEKLNTLLEQAKTISQQLKDGNTLPRPDRLAVLVMDLAEALQQLETKRVLISRNNTDPANQDNADKTPLLSKHVTTLHKQNKTLTRQLEEVEKKNLFLKEKVASSEAWRKRYHELFEYAPEAYIISDKDGTIIEANQAAAEMLHTRAAVLVGSCLTDFIAEQDQPLMKNLLSHPRQVQDIEMIIVPRGRSPLDSSLSMTTVYAEDGSPLMIRWLLNDITERRRALAALDASERRFRTIFSEANLGIILAELDGRIIRTNRAFQQMIGYSDRELFGMALARLTFSNEPLLSEDAWLTLFEGKQSQVQFEQRLLAKDGSLVWSSLSLSLLPDEQSQPQYLMALVENISMEKQTAADLGEMRRRLLESSESERLRLAQELHDGPMQDLYGAVFRLSNFLDQTSDTRMQDNIHEIQEILKHVASTLRSVCGELRPPTLSNLGLERAIRSHAERIQELHTEMEIQLNLTNDGQTLTAHTRMAFFRIYQQCIANVLRHAQATRVVVAFHFNENEATLDVWDNGQGFTLPEKWVDLMRSGRFGLAGIAERAHALGAELKIETNPGAGTLVHISAPRDKEI